MKLLGMDVHGFGEGKSIAQVIAESQGVHISGTFLPWEGPPFADWMYDLAVDMEISRCRITTLNRNV